MARASTPCGFLFLDDFFATGLLPAFLAFFLDAVFARDFRRGSTTNGGIIGSVANPESISGIIITFSPGFNGSGSIAFFAASDAMVAMSFTASIVFSIKDLSRSLSSMTRKRSRLADFVGLGRGNQSRRFAAGHAPPDSKFFINASMISCGPSRNCFAYRDHRGYMQNIEITDPKEARRVRYAQYRGEKATVMLNGLRVTGMVRSVMEVKSSNPTRWIVSVVPKQGIAA